MVNDSGHDYSFFDTLINQNGIFAVYRAPGSTVVKFLIQESGNPLIVQEINLLNGKNGFVVAPFSSNNSKPIVVFRNDILLEGEDEIFNYLKTRNPKKEKLLKTQIRPFQSNGFDDFSRYEQAFKSMHSSLLAGKCEKVVLSRKVSKAIPIDFSAGKAFLSASNAYPEAFVCLFSSPLTGTWLLSSPEMILSGKGRDWQTVSLAGTKYATDNKEKIRWDKKNLNEQEIVSSCIEKQLVSMKLDFSKNGPYTTNAGKLIHLQTDYFFKLNDDFNPAELLESLHPTPAVCGYPRENALSLILESEGYDRGYYSGFSGPFIAEGETCLFVNLRCMEITSKSLDLYAGGGLMPTSKLLSEWEETEAKLQTMLSLIETKKTD